MWKAGQISVSPPLPRNATNPTPFDDYDIYYEQCGATGNYCWVAPAGFSGSCGTWLGMDNYCCFAIAVNLDSPNQEEEGLFKCDTIPGIMDTPYAQFGKATFEYTLQSPSDTCPNGSLQAGDALDGVASCCDTGGSMTYGACALLELDTANDALNVVNPIRCGEFDIFPTEGDIEESNRILSGSSIATLMPTGGPATATSRPSSSEMEMSESSTATSDDSTPMTTAAGSSSAVTNPPASTGGSRTTSSAAAPTSTSSATKGISLISSLILGSTVLSILLGAQL
ncbi:hypothetical protein H072_4225 [Dactylellina haptotyla CBS 200.50]|uniref:Uncharacterized protein n=1 Tax=Dactylellina haptotyla (strain CBS 200.50) TaxID=1284197 RepID=S8AL58_DACHA|nr:hypothetical protein H072_4225 [Dactylellina haptotyla CBS 200.50]